MPISNFPKSVLNLHQWFDAAKYNNTQLIKQFLDEGFDIEARDDMQRTALHVAATHNAADVALILLKNNANLEAKNKHEVTPLLDAMAWGHVKIVLLFLKFGANHRIRDEYEWTALHWIAYENCLQLADALSQKVPNIIRDLIHTKRWNGITPLHMVTSAAMAKKLIALGAEIDSSISNHIGTPLIEATEQNQVEVVMCLVQHGANILQVDCNNQTAYDIAIKENYIQIKNFFKEILFQQNASGRKKTDYVDNVTAALKARNTGIDEQLIELHANLRINLFFLTLIAYYNSGLTVNIEHTNRQHGKGSGETRACHSAILTSLWDTRNEYPRHRYPTRHTPDTPSFYCTGILNRTHFENSLNLTVELHKSVNYFDTYYIEGNKNQLMRAVALDILNQVSRGQLNPIEGINLFLVKMHNHFLSIQTEYFNKKDLPTSPQNTRPVIYAAQYKGTFFNACGFKSPNEVGRVIKLKKDYIQSQLPLSKDERIQLKDKSVSAACKTKIYEKAFVQVKEDINLPVQYRHI